MKDDPRVEITLDRSWSMDSGLDSTWKNMLSQKTRNINHRVWLKKSSKHLHQQRDWDLNTYFMQPCNFMKLRKLLAYRYSQKSTSIKSLSIILSLPISTTSWCVSTKAGAKQSRRANEAIEIPQTFPLLGRCNAIIVLLFLTFYKRTPPEN